MEELLSRHRKETRELQARITSKKKNATKKTRKGVNDECTSLENQLKDRHAAELAALQGDGGGDNAQSTSSSHPLLDSTLLDDSPPPVSPLPPNGAGPWSSSSSTSLAANMADLTTSDATPTKRKGNRQKARLARRAAEQEAAAEEAAQEAASLPDLRARERAAVDAELAVRGLVEHEVRSDGHCLYAAMADQLGRAGLLLLSPQPTSSSSSSPPLQKEVERKEEGDGGVLPDFKVVRKEVARFVLDHADDFAPFLDEDDLQHGGVEGYAAKIADSAAWGGQMEILACARRWGLVVNVLQGDGRIERIEGGAAAAAGQQKGTLPEKECWLAYYRHSFGLGEHYNSLRRKVLK